ncbi:cytochrome P450 [Micromonospora olivasterospora]|uniref:Cytochrome P450 n=1 Tax=Micromonospora olivasterospora TaxID=1880 RepID=A0A562IHZ1_MICOL|nr:cytochrome P450 [Micromonospora olivasterospora]TWH70637.1 cytochrome P450 [Micromonospora olivasterospora]
MTISTPDRIAYEPFRKQPRDQLLPVLAKLREEAPVYRTGSDMWVVSRYADVKNIIKSPHLFSSRPNASEGTAFPVEAADNPEQLQQLMALMAGFPAELDVQELTQAPNINGADPPDHSRLRRIASRAFTPARIAQLFPAIDAIVDECLEGIDKSDSFNVVRQLAIPLPTQIIVDLLGFGDGMRDQVKKWSDDFVDAAIGDVRGTAEGAAMEMRVFQEFSLFVAPLIERRREDPQGDIISAMVQSMSDDTLNTAEALMMAITVMVGGNETTTSLIGGNVVELCNNPDQLALLKADPSLLPGAVDEANRLTSPIQFMFREALADVEIAGTTIPKGAIVVLQMAAANRDPAEFDDPDEFRIDRPQGRNLSFGHGIHFCLGAHLATAEVRSAVGKLLPHLDRFELDTATLQLNPTMLHHGYQNIDLRARS